MKSCTRCLPYIVYLAVRRCERIVQRWNAGAEQTRIAVLVQPNEHPTVAELVSRHLAELGLDQGSPSQWLYDGGLMLEQSQVQSAKLSASTPVYPVFSERLITVYARVD